MEAERPDVLVSDIGMPGEDGYAFIRRVRALAPTAAARCPPPPSPPTPRARTAQRVLSAGFQVHLPKPVQPAELAPRRWPRSRAAR